MEKLTLKELSIPIIKSIDIFNYLLKSHHRRTAIITYYIAKEIGLNEEELLETVIAASMHDIGALSVQERDSLIENDVENPTPHCIMGYRMLLAFKPFKKIAEILKHHHIKYKEYEYTKKIDTVHYACLIIHLADRIDIQIHPNKYILNQRDRIVDYMKSKSGTIFAPELVNAFIKISKSDIFWIDINNLTIEQLYNRMSFCLDFELEPKNIMEFSTVLARIVDYRSHYTVSHSYTVSALSEVIGSMFNISLEDRKKLMIAGFIHDIGKIGIDPYLIEKPGKLTQEEYNQVKLHSYYTGQILEDLLKNTWLRDVIIWARSHHERTDGSGYPYALQEEEITEEMKIIAFADVISALMEERPYRGSLSVEEAFNIIEEKIAPSISIDMFKIIKENKTKINETVLNTHDSIFKEYEDISNEIIENEKKIC